MSLIPKKYEDAAVRSAKTFVEAGVAAGAYAVLHSSSLNTASVEAGAVAAAAAAVAAAWNAGLVALGSRRAAKAVAFEALVEKEVASHLPKADQAVAAEVQAAIVAAEPVAAQPQDLPVEQQPAQPHTLPVAEQPAQPAAASTVPLI
jgi:hypothetical protein